MQRESTPDLAARLDLLPVTWLHCVAVGLCALGFSFDLLEVALGGVLSAVFSAPASGAAPGQLPLLLAAMYLGATAGAPALGWLADRYGRQRTLSAVLALLALASLAGAWSGSVGMLTVWRCVAGVALGGYPPLMIAYLTDLLPASRRGLLVLVAVAVGTLGPAAGVFLVRALAPLQPLGIDGWRWGFIGGGLGAALVALLFRALPESPRWLHSRGRAADAEAACRRLERSPMVMRAMPPAPPSAAVLLAEGGQAAPGARRWTMVAVLFYLSAWSTVAFPILNGAVLSARGLRLADTLLVVGLSFFGPLVGTLLAGLWVDRLGRRAAMAGCAGGMLLSGAGFVVSTGTVALSLASFGFMLWVSLFTTVLNLYGAELFATRRRATALAGAWAFNRLGAVMAPLVLLPLLASAGQIAMFGVIGASLVASAALLLFMPPGRQARAVA